MEFKVFLIIFGVAVLNWLYSALGANKEPYIEDEEDYDENYFE